MNTINDFSPQAVVIDAGQFPTSPQALRWLSVTDKIVCCDGAANAYLSRPGARAWRIVGDCDSLSPLILSRYADIVRRRPDQETNDQTKAVTYLAHRGLTPIAIIGATGLREDHTFGNISLLIDYHLQGIEARAYTDHGVFIPASGTRTFHCPTGTQVSIFNFGATGLHADGLRYPLRDFTTWWQGTLNETTAPTFTIHAHGPYLLFLTYHPNPRDNKND
nr:thiamine diphosphokinase [Bacteroides sp.]